MMAYANASDDTRFNTRARRIKRNVWEQDGVPDWYDGNAVGFSKLKYMQYIMGFEEPYSDEEDKDENEEPPFPVAFSG